MSFYILTTAEPNKKDRSVKGVFTRKVQGIHECNTLVKNDDADIAELYELPKEKINQVFEDALPESLRLVFTTDVK